MLLLRMIDKYWGSFQQCCLVFSCFDNTSIHFVTRECISELFLLMLPAGPTSLLSAPDTCRCITWHENRCARPLKTLGQLKKTNLLTQAKFIQIMRRWKAVFLIAGYPWFSFSRICLSHFVPVMLAVGSESSVHLQHFFSHLGVSIGVPHP